MLEKPANFGSSVWLAYLLQMMTQLPQPRCGNK
jgi:hypothetical protein